MKAKEYLKEHGIPNMPTNYRKEYETGINDTIEAVEGYHQAKLKLLNIANVSKSLLIEVLKRYETWEANLIMEDSCWEGSLPTLTNELYEELLEIQKLRNEALSNVC